MPETGCGKSLHSFLRDLGSALLASGAAWTNVTEVIRANFEAEEKYR